MVFSSIIFVFGFLPVVLIVYALLPPTLKKVFLLFASLLFYFWGEQLLVCVLLISTYVDFCCARYIEQHSTDDEPLPILHNSTACTGRKIALLISICSNLLLLVYFKYQSFFIANINALFAWFQWDQFALSYAFVVPLPLGISFFTFQSMSYTIDVYRRRVRACSDFVTFGCYVSMFPQLVAGPIVRYSDIAGELQRIRFSLYGMHQGFKRFVIGLGKKVLIANTVALPADVIFDLPPDQLTCALVWLGVICYTLQIYYDFSGYSDMAIGIGCMLGFTFPENFQAPYRSQSIREFWQRWHMTLSSWIRDYIYIPLGGSRFGTEKTYRNLLFAFTLCGLWHGANWTFVIWGLFHGLFLILERLGLANTLQRSWQPARHLYVVLVVMIGWVLFRSDSLTHAFSLYQAMLGFTIALSPSEPFSCLLTLDMVVAMVAGVLLILPIPAGWQHWQEKSTHSSGTVMSAVSLLLYWGLFTASMAKISAGGYNPFIYFQF